MRSWISDVVLKSGASGAALLVLACAEPAPTRPAAPPLSAAPLPPRTALVGEPLRLDASAGGTAFIDPDGAGLRYQVTFVPDADGLRADGAVITGVPVAPAVIRITVHAATGGGEATQQFPLVVWGKGLTAPVVSSFQYATTFYPIPQHFLFAVTGSVLPSDDTPADNPVTDAGAALGRVLFYDVRLSANDREACASCHHQSAGFGDTARFGRGFTGQPTRRKVMALANARFYGTGRFFWDERAATLEAQTLQPIQDSLEMGLTLPDLVTKLNATEYYPALFQAAFGTPEITSDRVARALAQFIRAMLSTDAPIDAVFTGGGPPDVTRLTPEQQEGLQLFTGSAGCSVCHRTNAQILDVARNTGLDLLPADSGAGQGRFKVPSLRNVAVRAPYMHDGRFATLRDVVDFYDHGIQPSAGLDARLRNADGTPRRLELAPSQRAALVAYLESLTDPVFLTTPRFSTPFPGP